MSGQAVNDLARELVRIPPAERQQLEAALGTEFRPSEEDEAWSSYEFDLPEGPFAQGAYRVGRAGDRARLSLVPRDPGSLLESALDLTAWGEVQNIGINPRIPPEGTDTLSFEVDSVRLGFEFTHHTRQLRTLAVRWGPAE